MRLVIVFTTLCIAAGCSSKTSGGGSPASSNRTAPARSDGAVADDGQWLMAGKAYDLARYSALDQINTGNVSQLKLAWSFATGTVRGLEAAPVVVGSTMYVVTPFPNVLYALDLNNNGALKWKYEPKPDPSSQGLACCDTVNRGVAFDHGRIYMNAFDMHTIAVDAETGKEVWKTKVGDFNTGESFTMAPIVAKGKVLVGNSGGEFGVRGWVTALDADTGKIAWRAYSTGPDSDVLIGPSFKPFYAADRKKDLGVSTWPGDAWKIGGAGMWGWISYDPELDLIYYGTANPGPWNPDVRPGDNKWASTIFARRPETGEAVWAYQISPHDTFDYDGVNECILTDLTIGGAKRKVLLHPDRNGRMYVIDRATGEVLSAETFGYQNTSTHVDLKTGRIAMVESKAPGFGKVIHDICPAAPGAKDWQPSAFSYRTGLLYIPHNNLCMEEEGLEANYISGTPYVGANVRMYAGPGGHRGEYSAFDPVAGKTVWKIDEKFPVWSGTVTTKGDVAFYGTMDRWFKAIDIHDGKVLWQTRLGSGVISQPIVYKGPDGKEYVAVGAGVGGWSGAIVPGGLDPRDGTGALGFVNAMGDLPQYTGAGGTYYVFALP